MTLPTIAVKAVDDCCDGDPNENCDKKNTANNVLSYQLPESVDVQIGEETKQPLNQILGGGDTLTPLTESPQTGGRVGERVEGTALATASCLATETTIDFIWTTAILHISQLAVTKAGGVHTAAVAMDTVIWSIRAVCTRRYTPSTSPTWGVNSDKVGLIRTGFIVTIAENVGQTLSVVLCEDSADGVVRGYGTVVAAGVIHITAHDRSIEATTGGITALVLAQHPQKASVTILSFLHLKVSTLQIGAVDETGRLGLEDATNHFC